MSARVMNPAMMTEMSRKAVGGGGGGGGRVVPSRAALARVRRDLFGPVDHAAARALAERELKAQSISDSDRWGFDFHLEIPKSNSKYDWEAIGPNEVVPEPYALRGMRYLHQHAPTKLKKIQHHIESDDEDVEDDDANDISIVSNDDDDDNNQDRNGRNNIDDRNVPTFASPSTSSDVIPESPDNLTKNVSDIRKTQRTPPQYQAQFDEQYQEHRVPDIDPTMEDGFSMEQFRKKHCNEIPEPTTPVLPIRKQSSITDFMKSRKRTLNGTKKNIEPPEKITRNTGQIRS